MIVAFVILSLPIMLSIQTIKPYFIDIRSVIQSLILPYESSETSVLLEATFLLFILWESSRERRRAD